MTFESRKQLLALVAVAALGLPSASLAHGSTKPQHGGVVQMTGETLVELVSTALRASPSMSMKRTRTSKAPT